MGLTVTRTTTQSPLSAEDLREHLRGSEVSDSYLRSLAVAATDHAENYTGRTILTATVRLTLERFAEVIRLPAGPVSSVDSVKYIDSTETLATLDASLWRATTDSEPVRITRAYGASWPSPLPVTEAVQVNYTAGYGDTLASAPEAIQHAVKLLVEHLHDPDSKYAELQAQRLLDPYKLGPFAAFAGLDNPCAVAS